MVTAWALLSGGSAEHAVVTIDKKEWGHRGRQCAPIITLSPIISQQKAFFIYIHIFRFNHKRAKQKRIYKIKFTNYLTNY